MSKQRPLYLFLLAVVSLNTVLWLDSFDRYLSSRYHLTILSEILPDRAFEVSRQVQAAIGQIQQFATSRLTQVIDRAPSARAADFPAPTAQVTAEVAPAPVAPAPVAPAPVAPAPVAPAPVTPAPVAPAPVAPAPVAPAQSTGASAPSTNVSAVLTFPKVLFAGDSMMQGVAPLVINQLRKENPKGTFVDLSAQSTGLTVRRYFDWPTKIKEETLARGFEVIAIFLGPNDPWDIYEGAKRYAFGTPEWEDKYRDRVIEVMQFAQDQKVHVIWIGLPNMKEERVKRGAIVQNKIFREQANQFNFDYLSTEDFLGGLDEPFKKFIDEPGKGQIMIRADDGIHFTQAGLRLIATRLYELIKQQARP